MAVHEALASGFVAEGTSIVFGIMGEANMHWLNSMASRGVKVVDVRHEGVALAMADGWAQMTHRPGVATTTSGPGVTQLATSLVVASRARTPLVVFCGDVSTADTTSVQKFDIGRFAAATETGHVEVPNAEAAYDSVTEAFYRAKVERRPMILSARTDVQRQRVDDLLDYTPSHSLLGEEPMTPSIQAIHQAVDVLARAERPVVIVGRGALNADALTEAIALANQCGALLATTLLAKNSTAGNEYDAGIAGLFSSKVSMELFAQADVVVAIGASLNHYTTENGYLFPDARYVHLEKRSEAFMGHGRRADVFVHGDAKLSAQAILDQLRDKSITRTGYRTSDVSKLLSGTQEQVESGATQDRLLEPTLAAQLVDSLVPENFGLVVGNGHQSHFATMHMTRPRSFTLVNKHFGCIGQGIGTSIGASFASERTPGVLIEGDASLMMHVGDFETAVRYEVPLLVVVFNDQGLGAEYHKSLSQGLDERLARISTPSLDQVAEALGGRGWIATTEAELEGAIRAFVSDPGPGIVDVRISPNVLSIPYRRLQGDLSA